MVSTHSTQKGAKRDPIFCTSNILKTSTTLTCSSGDLKTTTLFSEANKAPPKDRKTHINQSARDLHHIPPCFNVFVRMSLWKQFLLWLKDPETHGPLPKVNIAQKKWTFPKDRLRATIFQGRAVGFRECTV